MAEAPPAVDLKSLHAKIGKLTLENDFLSGALGKAGLFVVERKAMIERSHELPLTRQAALLRLGRVIPPFLTGPVCRIHAARFSFCAGVIPPMPIFGRSLLYVQSHFVA